MWVTHSRILPVKVDAIEFVLIHKREEILLELVAVGWLDGGTKDVESPGLCAEIPPAKRDDFLDIFHFLEELKLLLDLTDINCEVILRDSSKGKVDVSVFIRVNLVDIHRQTLALVVPSFKVRNLDLLSRC